MLFAGLRVLIVIRQRFAAKLLAGKIKFALPNHVIAMKAAVFKRNAVHLTAEDILYEKGRDGALPHRFVFK